MFTQLLNKQLNHLFPNPRGLKQEAMNDKRQEIENIIKDYFNESSYTDDAIRIMAGKILALLSPGNAEAVELLREYMDAYDGNAKDGWIPYGFEEWKSKARKLLSTPPAESFEPFTVEKWLTGEYKAFSGEHLCHDVFISHGWACIESDKGVFHVMTLQWATENLKLKRKCQ